MNDNKRPNDPHRRPLAIRDAMKQLFDNSAWHPFGGFFNDPFWWNEDETAPKWMTQSTPSLDISETKKDYTIEMEVPGYNPDNINVEIENDVLTVTGKHEEDNEENDKTYYRKERSVGSFQRCIKLPSHVNTDETQCESKNGILTITIPKKKEEQKKIINVKVQ